WCLPWAAPSPPGNEWVSGPIYPRDPSQRRSLCVSSVLANFAGRVPGEATRSSGAAGDALLRVGADALDQRRGGLDAVDEVDAFAGPDERGVEVAAAGRREVGRALAVDDALQVRFAARPARGEVVADRAPVDAAGPRIAAHDVEDPGADGVVG